LGIKILKFFDEDPGSGIRDGDSSDPGWKKVGSGIRDKHPGSATLKELFLIGKELDSSTKKYICI
jgi:hypothetical protein